LDFSLTPEQLAVQETAREFARREIDPIVDEHDESQKFPLAVMKKAAELGFLGVIFPEELGGAALGYVEYVLVVTELSAVDPSVGISVAAHNSLGTNHIYKFGSPAQRERWVAPLARGEKIAAWALTEAGAGSDAAAGRTRARKVDGGWVLDGAKVFCTHGSVGDVAVVMAVTEPPDSGAPRGRHMSAFVVERGAAGFRTGKKENKLGIRASDTAELVFEECFVPDDHLLGARGEGFKQAMAVLDGGRISIAALGLGTAIGAYRTALAYAQQREQFGKPIAEFQAIRFTLAEMATRIAAAEILTFAAAAEMDRTGKVTLKASEAKLMAGEAAVFCSERGVQIHGGYGLVKDYRAEKYYRDAKICTIGEGTSEIQRLVIARQLLARTG
jgi:alkylation response protein AidB-like acyl-CoA dehydrogenase